MGDVVVTVPKNFKAENYWDRDDFDYSARGLAAWISEGDLPGTEATDVDTEWCFSLGGNRPNIKPGERVYIVCEGKLRGYAPLLYIDDLADGRYGLIRSTGAVAVTIDEPIRGFQGFRYRWWDREDEKPFPDWKVA